MKVRLGIYNVPSIQLISNMDEYMTFLDKKTVIFSIYMDNIKENIRVPKSDI